jgi:hypothetical protein
MVMNTQNKVLLACVTFLLIIFAVLYIFFRNNLKIQDMSQALRHESQKDRPQSSQPKAVGLYESSIKKIEGRQFSTYR